MGNSTLWAYLSLILVVFSFNLAPAFAPPTWTVLVYFRLGSEIPALPLVLVGAASSASGRASLAFLTGKLRRFVSTKQRENLAAAGEVLNRRTSHHIFGLALFALSPLPSAQLFEAAGLIGARIIPLTLSFFSGRIVSYGFFVAGASKLKSHGLGEIVMDSFKSPWGIALQILMLIGIYLLTRIDWKKRLIT